MSWSELVWDKMSLSSRNFICIKFFISSQFISLWLILTPASMSLTAMNCLCLYSSLATTNCIVWHQSLCKCWVNHVLKIKSAWNNYDRKNKVTPIAAIVSCIYYIDLSTFSTCSTGFTQEIDYQSPLSNLIHLLLLHSINYFP